MKEIDEAVRITMFHPKEKEELLNLKEKTELIRNRRFGIDYYCDARETGKLQTMIHNSEAFISLFETNSTVQTMGFDALVVCKNKQYYLIKWKI